MTVFDRPRSTLSFVPKMHIDDESRRLFTMLNKVTHKSIEDISIYCHFRHMTVLIINVVIVNISLSTIVINDRFLIYAMHSCGSTRLGPVKSIEKQGASHDQTN